MNRLLPLLLFTIAMLPAYGAHSTQPVFVRSRCDKKLSSVVLSSLKDAITASGKYRLVSGLDDDGKLNVVHTIYMMYAENNDVTAVATQYGIAKCHNSKECGSVNDGESLNVSLCNASLSTDCGRALFNLGDHFKKAANDYQFKTGQRGSRPGLIPFSTAITTASLCTSIPIYLMSRLM